MPNTLLDNEARPLSSWVDSPIVHAHRTYLAFLQELFRGPEGAIMSDLWYSDDPLVSKMNIIGAPSVDMRMVVGRPTIIVSPQNSVGGAGIIGDVDEVDLATGKIIYLEHYRGALAVYVISDAPAHALRLAEILRDLTWAHQRTLIQNGKFYSIGRGISIGPALAPGSLVTGQGREKAKVVPVTVPFAFLRRTSVQPVNTRTLGSLVVKANAEGPFIDEETVPWGPGYTVEQWVREFNKARGYTPPGDPAETPPALPQQPSNEGQLLQIEVRVDQSN